MVTRTPAPHTAPPAARSYQQLLTKLLRHGAYPQLRKIVEKTLPADISPVLPLLLEDDRKRILSLLIESGKAARVLLELDDAGLEEVLESIDDPTLASVCSSSAPDDAADLLDVLEEDRRARILEILGATQGAKLESLLEGEEETAGSLMNTEFFALDEELTVAQAIEAIRQYPRKESFFYVYCADADQHLVGVLSLRSLILADPEVQLKDIMVQSVVRTHIDSSPEEVAQLVSKYDLLSIPVVDLQNRLVGVVTVDDVLDVIQPRKTFCISPASTSANGSAPPRASRGAPASPGWPSTSSPRSSPPRLSATSSRRSRSGPRSRRSCPSSPGSEGTPARRP